MYENHNTPKKPNDDEKTRPFSIQKYGQNDKKKSIETGLKDIFASKSQKQLKAEASKEALAKTGHIAMQTAKITSIKAGKFLTALLNVFLTILLIGLITGTAVGITFAVYIKNNLAEDYDITSLKLNLDMTSKIYYKDKSANWIEIEDQRLHGGENRTWTSIQEMPVNLRNAFVSIEDKRFYTNSGVDWRRTFGAVLEFVSGNTSYGGSTITQQLIKNFSGEDEVTVQRKIKEIFRALSLTKKRSKDEILEMYLNTISLSERCYGVQSAANFYFGKQVSELSLVECAALAAIPKSPTKYDPLRNPENNKERRDVVLMEMYKLNWITKEEYEAAVGSELVLNISNAEETETSNTNSYFTDALIEQIATDLQKQYGYPREFAMNLIYSGGLTIHSTENPKIQNIIEEYFKNPNNFPKGNGVGPQSAMVIMDFKTGDVVGLVGGIGEKTGNRTLNRATMSKRQIGSSIKPLTVYAPAIDLGYINYSTVLDDSPFKKLENGSYWPKNAPKNYEGLVTVNYAIEKSKNTIAVKVMQMLTPQYSYEFATQKLGIKSLEKSDIDYAPLALGGLTYGLTVMEVTSAYTIFPNQGVYSAPRLYTEVLDNSGNVLLSNPEVHNIAVRDSTAKIMTKMMQNVIFKGTGAAVTLKNKVNVAGKTGSTEENKDQYFAGFTPYYVGACWFGYDTPKYIGSGTNPALIAWDKVMTKIHTELVIPEAKASGEELKTFDFSGLVQAEFCKDSGKKPSDACYKDLGYIDLGSGNLDGNAKAASRGSRIETGWFKAGTEPTEECDKHVIVKWDKTTNAVANNGCPKENVIEIALVREDNRNFEDQVTIADAQFTYRDVPGGYVYPMQGNVPFYDNLLNKDGRKYYSGTSNVSFPANAYCIDHAHLAQKQNADDEKKSDETKKDASKKDETKKQANTE